MVMPIKIKFQGLEKHLGEEVTMHYGGRIRTGFLRYLKDEKMFFLDCYEGRIELGDGEKIKVKGREYITSLI